MTGLDIAAVASKVGDPMIPGAEPLLMPGVRGVLFDEPDGIYIPFIAAEKPGSGDVAKFLDALPHDRRVVFSTVLSQRLRGMLERRGFQPVRLHDEMSGEDFDAMEKRP